MKSRATIKDVARLARVSIGTVSRVVNGNQAVTEQNRLAVFEAIEQLGYRPSSVARSLVGQTVRTKPNPAMPPTAPRLITVGYVSIDHTILTDAMPDPGSRIAAKAIHRSVGGPAANVAIAASRVGSPFPVAVDLVSALGNDQESDWALAELLEAGISVEGVERVMGGRLSRSMIIVEAGGRRTIFNEPLSLPVPKIRHHIAAAREPGRQLCLHLEGYRVSLIDELDLTGPLRPDKITLDTTGLPPTWQTPENFIRLRQLFDVIFLSRPVARRILGRDIEDADLPAALDALTAATLQGAKSASLVITLGAAGSAVLRPGRPVVAVPALPVEAIDVTGAGDIFAGVFLAVFLNGGDEAEAARWAAIGSSYSTTAVGVNTVKVRAELIQQGLALSP